ncbi:dihydrolipoamide acetyltransferase family protein [Bacillus xiapuensis]|uniref:dihydrolipoamide acetyltransferase family protein n=1 Tax=Bacillus xiapuensis TaxID=2014075 RepID=UPI000C249E0B|nr:dihydrolipoamide acetyltransferase family protein [Bacillus xiapuensis]
MSETIIMPKLGMTMTEGSVTEWYKEVGEAVEKGESVLAISSEKLNQDIEAPISGVLLKKYAEAGEELEIGAPLAVIGQKEEDVPASISEISNQSDQQDDTGADQEEMSEEQASEKASPKPTSKRVFITPLARKMVQREQLDITKITGTGGNGRITKRDVLRALEEGAAQQTEPQVAQPVTAADKIGEGLSPMRKAIARNMRESLAQTAQLTLHRKVCADDLINFQKTLRQELATNEVDVKLTLTVLLARAAVLALREMKQMNAHYVNGQLTEYDEVHLGIATALPDGLVVPVIHNAHQKTIGDLARTMAEVTNKARSGQAGSDILSGSTFTISNLGASDIEYFTPILNKPETGILGIGSFQEELSLAQDGTVKKVNKIPLSLTFDHQILDGAAAAQFLRILAKYIESPYLLIL